MNLSRSVLSLVLLASAVGCQQSTNFAAASRRSPAETTNGPFLVKPYLQWGDDQGIATMRKTLLVLWADKGDKHDWIVEYRTGAGSPWQVAESPTSRLISAPGLSHWLYRATLRDLDPGVTFAYRLRKGGEAVSSLRGGSVGGGEIVQKTWKGGDVVFSAEGRAPKSPEASHRFVAFGDCGVNSAEQRVIAYQAYQARPDFVMITGDIVYDRGRVSEYGEKFWPIYNADTASPSQGAPLLRSTPFLAAPGNHDIGSRDLGRYPDGLAYFLYWAQPLNGPTGVERSAHVPALTGPDENKEAFLEAAGPNYPRMANFSFDYGNAHWTVLDANPYVDWTDRDLRSWVEHDLAAAKGATWRFVSLHQPGFNSAKKHSDEQNMRLLAEVFEAGGVDLVFCGHVHNYQRTYPLRFAVDRGTDSKPTRRKELINGHWKLDKAFDGQLKTRPEGVIYLVTGGGGASLYNPEQEDDPASWQEFTHKFVSRVHSLTVADVNGPTLTVRQISLRGEELDRFRVTK